MLETIAPSHLFTVSEEQQGEKIDSILFNNDLSIGEIVRQLSETVATSRLHAIQLITMRRSLDKRNLQVESTFQSWHNRFHSLSLPRRFRWRVSWHLMTIVSDWSSSTEMCNRTDDYEMLRIDTDRLLFRSSTTFSPRETTATVSLQWSEFSFGHLRYLHS